MMVRRVKWRSPGWAGSGLARQSVASTGKLVARRLPVPGYSRHWGHEQPDLALERPLVRFPG
jgi:hypothetical protein